MPKANASEKPKIRISVGLILSWIFGIIFFFDGLAVIATGSAALGVVISLLSLFIIPYTNTLIGEKTNIELSRGIKIGVAVVILILFSMSGFASSGISPTSITTQTGADEPAETGQTKVRQAEITIDRVQLLYANLAPTRLTVSNTGDVTITPRFDFTVYDLQDRVVCQGSPSFSTFPSVAPGDTITDEEQLLDCSFDRDGEYTLQVDLLDSDYTNLDTDRKDFTVSYWGQFGG
ncbi:MAG: hypothetical protein HYS81_04865 [Candidatus Aenigmatarchaeota archaeon]|nr:MAG: hypothetical protein HYS81_04865 [Candidatus Aenigmarchaeota archaeon]